MRGVGTWYNAQLLLKIDILAAILNYVVIQTAVKNDNNIDYGFF